MLQNLREGEDVLWRHFEVDSFHAKFMEYRFKFENAGEDASSLGNNDACRTQG